MEMAMRIFLIPVLLFGLFVASPARAQQATPSPEALAVAKEMMDLLSGDTIAQMSSTIMAQTVQPLERLPNMTPEKLAEIRTEVQKITVRFMNAALADAPAIYARHLTVSEMREIIAFNRTPTGEKMRKLLPQMMGEVMSLIAPRAPLLQRELIEAIQPILQRP
jgi:uncharacterized protein